MSSADKLLKYFESRSGLTKSAVIWKLGSCCFRHCAECVITFESALLLKVKQCSGAEVHINLEFLTCDPLIHVMNHPCFIVSKMVEFIRIQTVDTKYQNKVISTSSRRINVEGAQWLSGRVLDSRQRDRVFEPHWRHCVVSLNKTHLSLLSTGSTQEDPSLYNWKIVDWDVKNQIKQTKKSMLIRLPFAWQRVSAIFLGFAQAWKELEYTGVSWKVLENKNLPWKVLEKHSKALKSPWVLPFTGGFNSVSGDLNQYKIVVPLFGAAYAAPNKGISILYYSS